MVRHPRGTRVGLLIVALVCAGLGLHAGSNPAVASACDDGPCVTVSVTLDEMGSGTVYSSDPARASTAST